MIIKEADSKRPALDALNALLARPDCSAEIRARIERERACIEAGVRGEEEAAYEMKVHWGATRNWMVIHDLRIEHGGLTAQIDHLLINRLMEFWVCESKHFSEGVAINEHGEFTAFHAGRPRGVPSPIAQNARHILILKRLLESGAVRLPTRLGLTIKPDLKSLVLVSKRARINRPSVPIPQMDSVIKNDQIGDALNKAIEQSNNPLLIAKVIGQDTLETLARDLARLHRPLTVDWAARFGLGQPLPASAAPAPPAAASEPADPDAQAWQNRVCQACGTAVSDRVARFCRSHRSRFGGRLYCIDCQARVAAN